MECALGLTTPHPGLLPVEWEKERGYTLAVVRMRGKFCCLGTLVKIAGLCLR